VFVAANGARLSDRSVTKLIVVVTDNPSANKSATLRESQLVRNAGIGLVTIGVGTYLDRYELSAVASYPYTKNMFITNTVRHLSNFTDPVKRIICGGPSKLLVELVDVRYFGFYFATYFVYNYVTKTCNITAFDSDD